MPVVWHQQSQMHVPVALLVSEFYRLEQTIRDVGFRELVYATFLTADRDKVLCFVGINPIGHVMRQGCFREGRI